MTQNFSPPYIDINISWEDNSTEMAAATEVQPRLRPEDTYTFRESPAGRSLPNEWLVDIEHFHALREDPGWRASHTNSFVAIRHGYVTSALSYEGLHEEVCKKLDEENPNKTAPVANAERVFITSLRVELYAERLRVHRHLSY